MTTLKTVESNKHPEFLRRYTDLPSLLHILKRKRLTLLSPNTWDDKNDSHYMDVYQNRKNLSTLLALCFTTTSETYHHWRVFSPGNSGICIKFNGPALIEHLQSREGVRVGPAQYKLLNNVREQSPKLTDLPFLKRHAFKDEREYRVIYESKIVKRKTKDISLPLHLISKITLSPWAPSALTQTITEIIKEIDGSENLRVGSSSLINNSEWRRIGAEAA